MPLATSNDDDRMARSDARYPSPADSVTRIQQVVEPLAGEWDPHHVELDLDELEERLSRRP